MQELQNTELKPVRFLPLFVVVYFFFYIFPFPLESLPFAGTIFKYYTKGLELLTIWTGENIIGLEQLEKIKMTGSGDTAFDYVKLFTIIILSVLVTGLLFLFRTKINTEKIIVFVRTYARYFLAFILLSYGFSKFFDGQFSYPSLERLDQKIGDSSPMGLLWTFMGYSKTYSVFGGLCQVSAGFLLFFRRTSVLGSLLALMVMTNIVVLNFSYDVPVKLFSAHLALISLLILYPNLRNLFNLLFLKKAVELIPEKSLIKKKEIGYGVLALKVLVITIGVFVLSIVTVRSVFDKPAHNLQAIYYPEEFTENQWDKLIINNRNATVFYSEKKYEDFDIEIDMKQQTIELKSKSDTLNVYKLKYRFYNDDKTMYLAGTFKTDSISTNFKVKRKEDFELVKRGFNWINKYPYNK